MKIKIDNKIIEINQKKNNRLETESHKLVQENKQLKKTLELSESTKKIYEDLIKDISILQEQYKNELKDIINLKEKYSSDISNTFK